MNKLIRKTSILYFLCLLIFQHAEAKLAVPAIFGNHMVMQQNSEVKIWGWGKPFEKVTILSSWSSDTLRTMVNHNGNWSLTLKTPKAGSGHSLRIQGHNLIEISDILIGEVWLCSGQSNMEWSVSHGINDGEELAQSAHHEDLRLFHVEWRSSPSRCLDVVGQWVKCTPETMREFSAIAYVFGKELNQQLKQPIGLISSNWGGTPIESWTSVHEIESDAYLCDAAGKLPYFSWAPNKPGYTYNAMLAPLMPFAIKGVLWYQGEANVDNAYAYPEMLETLVRSWREGFKTDFAFLYAQIAPFKSYPNDDGVKVRDAQRQALKRIPNSGMVILSDIGDTTDIHPRNKIDAGKRFAHVALHKTYHHSEYPTSGPLYKSHSVSGNKVEVQFGHSEGLYCSQNELNMFELAGEDLKWHKAEAQIKNNTVIVSSSRVKQPVHVRFEWKNAVMPILFNKHNLPASSFTTLDWRTEK